MALADWVEIFEGQSSDKLRSLQEKLLKQGEHSYASQGHGAKNYELAVGEFRDKLQAITRILRQRGAGGGDEYSGVADFSGLGGAS